MAGAAREVLWERLACAAIGGVLGSLLGFLLQVAWIAVSGSPRIDARFVIWAYVAGAALGCLIGPRILHGIVALWALCWGAIQGFERWGFSGDDYDPASPRPRWIYALVFLGGLVGFVIFMWIW